MKNTIVFYHMDMDGECAGYIAHKAITERGDQCFLKPINYGWNIDFDILKDMDEIYMVDFIHDNMDYMKELIETGKLVIIDHHERAIDRLKKAFPNTNIKGILETDNAGAYYTWKYFFPDKPVPKAVELVSAYDTWKHNSMPNVREADLAFRTLDLFPTRQTNRTTWDRLCYDDIFLENMIQEGKPLLAKLTNEHRKNAKFLASPIEFDGYRCLIANVRGVDSYFFDSLLEEHDPQVLIMFYIGVNRNGRYWKTMLRVAPKYADKVNVADIANKYGGSGHPGSAAFTVNDIKDVPYLNKF